MKSILKPPESRSRTKTAVFFSNNCGIGGARNRTQYLKELMNYIDVDSYGTCLNNKELPAHIRDGLERPKDAHEHKLAVENLVSLYSEYKFVLAFESNNITDFVTEKLMLSFEAGAVPVYMGAPNVDEWIPAVHSIIRTDQFDGPQSLAAHLKKLEKNKEEYDKYFSWKKNSISSKFLEKIDRCILNSELECRLCETIARQQLKQRPNYIGSIDKDIIMDRSYALNFDGVSSYVEIEDDPYLRLSEVFTINSWIYMKSTPFDFRIVDKNTAGRIDGFGFDVLQNNNQRAFLRLCAAGGCWNGMKPLFPETWYHVSVVFVSSAASERFKTMAGVFFYVNGELDYKIEFPVPMFGLRPARKNNLPLRIGRAGSGNSFWKGLIDDVSIWDIPLTPDEIRSVMFQRLGGKEMGLVAYYSFNEGSGGTTIDHSTARRDAKVVNCEWVPSEEKELVLNDCV